MIAPPPLGYKRKVSSLIDRVGCLCSPGSSNGETNMIGPQMIFKKIVKATGRPSRSTRAKPLDLVKSPSGVTLKVSKGSTWSSGC